MRSPNAMSRFAFLFLSILVTSIPYVSAQVRAFPEAQGFGTLTPGGRGGNVLMVTNLNDHGPGSLRAALEEDGPRIIVFQVSGLINLETALVVDHPYVTIAGQTAPGEGICIRGEGVRVKTHDVVVRYLRIRPGDIDFGPPNKWDDIDALTIGGNANEVYNIVLDHCSFSWAVDENVGIWGSPHDITIQYCIISEGLHISKHPGGGHSMGMLIGKKATNISVHHNLFAHNNDRNPHINGASKVDFRNNIIYNPGGVAIDLTGRKGQMINLVNNYIIRGPATKITSNILLRDTLTKNPKLYVAGNIGVYGKHPADNWLLVKDVFHRVPDRSMQSDAPFSHPEVNTQVPSAAYDLVLQDVGATLPLRDAVDRKTIRDIIDRKGSILSVKRHLLEWPPFARGIPFVDFDNDGIPNHWEEAFGLDTQQNDSALDKDSDGYTNIEEYLNHTNPSSDANNSTSGFLPQGSNSPAQDIPLYPQLKLTIEPNVPNPFSMETKVRFSVNKPGQLSIQVFDQEGREITELVDGFLYEGQYEFIWDASGVEPGVYTVSLQTKGHAESIRAIISR